MSVGFLLGLPGQVAAVATNVNTLLSRVTASAASYLDVAISSRAAAATALSNTIWTDARAAALDAVAGINGYVAAIYATPTLSPITAITHTLTQTPAISIIGAANPSAVIPAGSGTILSVTGKGIISFLAGRVVSLQSGVSSVGFKVTIDGVVLANVPTIFTSNNANMVPVIGSVIPTPDNASAPGIIIPEPINFKSSLLIEGFAAGGTVCQVGAIILYKRTG